MTDIVSYPDSLPATTGDVAGIALSAPGDGGASGDSPLQAGGEWSIGNADELRDLLAGFLAQGSVVVDFAGVTSCDTAALQLICSLRKTAIERGLRVRIAALSPAIEEVAAALGLAIAEITGVGEAEGDGRGI